jgi:BirA family biotin operon repressor/biotin-[acetyl-CoA-carboxylase] ligase
MAVMVRDQLIEILADGRFHSGEQLGERLSISRTAVWKQLRKLESMGLGLEKRHGVGYRIAEGTELLAIETIERGFVASTRRAIKHIELFASIDSTNSYARERATEKSCGGLLVLAEQQTAGRGRRGKTWVSPFASHLAISLVWDFEHGARALEGLSLAVGVAVRRALRAQGVDEVELKWPNDIYSSGKKMAGILLEMIGDPTGNCSVVVGVGINYRLCDRNAQSIDQPWTDVASESVFCPSRNPLLRGFAEHGFTPYRQEWQGADAYYGRLCTLSTLRESTTGKVVGVDDRGALLLELSDGRQQTFIGGELSLRLVP